MRKGSVNHRDRDEAPASMPNDMRGKSGTKGSPFVKVLFDELASEHLLCVSVSQCFVELIRHLAEAGLAETTMFVRLQIDEQSPCTLV